MPRKKSPVTPSRNDPGTFRLPAQCLNHYVTTGPNDDIVVGNRNETFKHHLITLVLEIAKGDVQTSLRCLEAEDCFWIGLDWIGLVTASNNNADDSF
jgi:hypothetical protein